MSTLIENIIENIKRYPILFDISHPYFKHSKIKDKAWDELSEEIQENVEVIKKKWKNLKDSYSKHLRTQKVKEGERARTIERYRSWPWAKQMEVFKPYLKFCQTEFNISSAIKHMQSPGDSGDESQPLPEMETNTQFMESQPGSSFHQEIFEDHCLEKAEESLSLEPPRKRKRIKIEKQNHVSSSVDRVITYLKNRNNNFTVDVSDPTEVIFLGYAKMIQKFSPRRQALIKMKIAKLIMEEELLQQQEDQASSQPESSSSMTSFP